MSQVGITASYLCECATSANAALRYCPELGADFPARAIAEVYNTASAPAQPLSCSATSAVTTQTTLNALGASNTPEGRS